MSFSLYGALPPSKSSKDSDKTKPTGLYSSLSSLESSTSTSTNTTALPTTPTTTTTTLAPVQKDEPAPSTGWSAITKFRPVIRRPTIQAKPKLNKPFIPAGATVVSTKTITKQDVESEIKEEPKQDTIDLGTIPLFTAADDVNGFRQTSQYKKKKKKKNNSKTEVEQQQVVFNMLEDYDPNKPNDYEYYKEERKELREQQKRKRDWEKRHTSRSRSRSPSGSPEPFHHEPSSSPPPPPPPPPQTTPAVKINVNETAEDAYKRRAMMTQTRTEQLHSAQDLARKVAEKYIIKEKPDIPVNKPTHVVLLTNMVGPGQVDDMLQQETAEECSKYGKVERCLIFEVPKGQTVDERAVRIFVKFMGIESAKRAVQDLNGRFFGGRVVSATFFDTSRFERLELAPTKEELNPIP
ncbi:uncharacterized protein B0P05DRAFT_541076 [Gilbertella persicaria]|uniref:uncharacterized protein n=1 Tax=Gilbertella persicaria TaxID=101096 RepID=UPI00221EFC3C|nr:uncharacterized protein B0P05DRAFT_541076 [Gilbertella persicaria]KAI8079557.1 hypothetical protein B0P05DRAFT_541076 [Gilbertella persicaria]